jgi:drug/metabolite transporter (DMT)-like permease
VDRRSWTLMWALALVWGASYLFIKVGLDDFDPGFLVFARLALAAAVLVPLAGRARAFAGIRERWRFLVVLAAVQVVAPFLLITTGEQHVASGLTGVLIASSPIFTALLSYAGFGPRVSGWNLGGVVLGILGVVLLFSADLTGSKDLVIGGLMIIVASLGYSVGALYLRARFGDVASLGIAAASMTMSALLTLPLAIVQAPDHMPALKSAASVAALGILGTGVAFGIYYTLISTVGAAKASLVAYLAPGFALAYGAVALGEDITASAIGGLVLILAGSWLAASGRAPWRRRSGAAVPVRAQA